jgi:hypothetical protein
MFWGRQSAPCYFGMTLLYKKWNFNFNATKIHPNHTIHTSEVHLKPLVKFMEVHFEHVGSSF